MTSKTSNQNNVTSQKIKGRKIHMAYSLNNTQPVVCTIVSDEPLFYMCEDAVADEDHLLYEENSFEAAELESEMAKLRHKMESYDKISTHYSKLKDERVQDFITESIKLTENNSAPRSTLVQIKQILSQSMFATALLDQVEKLGVKISLSNTVTTSYFNITNRQILINANVDLQTQSLLLVQELRKAALSKTNAYNTALSFHPDHAVLVNRAQQADLMATVIRTAWELKLKGQTEFWARIENSSFGDLGRAFAREACVDFRSLNSGKSMAAVFETWFLSERCRVHDKNLVQAMLANQDLYIADKTVKSDQDLVAFIHNIGEQPYGKNYLASYAHMILEDTVFTEVRDRANANFLWFIKFERSFNEAEQQLHSSDQQSAPDVQSGHFNDLEDRNNGIAPTTPQQSGNIIHIAFNNDRNHIDHIHE